MMRWFVAVILVAMSAAVGFIGFQQYQRMFGGDIYAAPFQLTDQKGQPITEADIRAQPTALFFGFTHCPEICPTTLFELDGWLKELGPEGEKLRAFFVTVDPARDTPEIMNQYVGNVSQRITGISGDPAKVEQMVRDYKVYFKKVETGGGDYTMDHMASVILLGKGGTWAGTIAYGENRDNAIAKLKRLAAGA